MTVKTPAELKTLYESISFDLQTTYTGPLGQEYAVSGTHLRLWAPTAQRVEVSLYRKGSGGEPIGTLQGSVQVRHCGRFGLWRFAFRLGRSAKARLSPCAEHTVHKVFPIVGICHGLPSVFVVFFQYSVPGQLLQFPLAKKTAGVYTYI